MRKTGTVVLVGAGCGAYDLITLRGKAYLEQCDTLVYDSLIDPRLLDFAPRTAERICVGKRAGKHSETQERIQEILIEKARQGKRVVRLKGGDPFVFGRGGEEILALQEAEIPYAIVPGISSSIAVPELAGIPVTHRKVSRSFHVITGHTADQILPDTLAQYAALEGTLVFLMGLGHLQEICDGLMRAGKDPSTPAAVVSNGASMQQKKVLASLSQIASQAKNAEMPAPGILIVGATAGMELSPTMHLPLEQTTVTVTGTKGLTEKLTSKLTALGAQVHTAFPLEVHPYEENPILEQELQKIAQYQWLVLTSINGVEILWQWLRKLHLDIRSFGQIRFAVIGAGTGERLRQYGIEPALVPEQYTSESLAEALIDCVGAEEQVLILRAEKATPVLTERLANRGIAYREIKTYDVESTAGTEKAQPQEIATDFLTFASASGVDAFFQKKYTISPDTKIVCIGAVTADALEKHGVFSALVSEVQTADGLIETILEEKAE